MVWMDLWSSARYDLRLTDDDFFALTPRQFDALLKRHVRQTESTELLFGQLTSWIANTGFRSTEKPTKALDFMPSQWRKKRASNPANSRRKRADIAFELRQTLAHFMRG